MLALQLGITPNAIGTRPAISQGESKYTALITGFKRRMTNNLDLTATYPLAQAKSQIGKLAWDLGERAIKANPDRVEGWNYAASGMGNYALGIGVFAALRQGIEGKFKDRLSHAEKIDPGFEAGAIQTVAPSSAGSSFTMASRTREVALS